MQVQEGSNDERKVSRCAQELLKKNGQTQLQAHDGAVRTIALHREWKYVKNRLEKPCWARAGNKSGGGPQEVLRGPKTLIPGGRELKKQGKQKPDGVKEERNFKECGSCLGTAKKSGV